MTTPDEPGRRRAAADWLVPLGLLAGAVISYSLLYAFRAWGLIGENGLTYRVWFDLSGTFVTAGIVLATFDRLSRRSNEQFAEELIRKTNVRTMLAGRMTPPIYQAVQRQILDEPVVVRDYHVMIRITRRRDDPNYVDLVIQEHFRMCNESTESRALSLRCTADLQYEDQFPGASKLTEISVVIGAGRPGPSPIDFNPHDRDIVLDDAALAKVGEREGAALVYQLATPVVGPGDEAKVARRRIKVQRSTDVNFWRAAQAMESADLEIEHDDDIAVRAMTVNPWNNAARKVSSEANRSKWILQMAVLPHQGFDISWEDRR